MHDLYRGEKLAQPDLPAVKLVERVWQERSMAHLSKTRAPTEKEDALKGQVLEWALGVNNRKVNGTCVKSLPTAVRLRLESGRLVWAPRANVRPINLPSLI